MSGDEVALTVTIRVSRKAWNAEYGCGGGAAAGTRRRRRMAADNPARLALPAHLNQIRAPHPQRGRSPALLNWSERRPGKTLIPGRVAPRAEP